MRTTTLLSIFALSLVACTQGTTPDNTASSSTTSMDSPQLYTGPLLTGKHMVTMKTTMGDIELELDADAAPKTVTNFVELAKQGYYDGLTFHRVIPDFMVQAGDPNGNGTGGASVFGAKFEDEINADSYGLNKTMLKTVITDQPLPPNLEDKTVKEYYEMLGYSYRSDLRSIPMDRGVIAMANAGPNTNGSQFFIIQKKDGTSWLNGKHTAFGHVTVGMDVVDAIAKVQRGLNDAPVTPVTFTVEVAE